MVGLYVVRDSALHRLPPGIKLGGLFVTSSGVLLLQRWWQIGLGVVVVLLGYVAARLDVRTATAQVRPLAWTVLAVGLFQLLISGWERAFVVTGQIAVLMMAAALVTLTTRTTALLDVVVRSTRPLSRLGVDPERLGLLFALGLRAIPVVVGLAEQVRDAQHSRGSAASPRAFIAPLLVRSLRRADAIAEALHARGIDD